MPGSHLTPIRPGSLFVVTTLSSTLTARLARGFHPVTQRWWDQPSWNRQVKVLFVRQGTLLWFWVLGEVPCWHRGNGVEFARRILVGGRYVFGRRRCRLLTSQRYGELFLIKLWSGTYEKLIDIPRGTYITIQPRPLQYSAAWRRTTLFPHPEEPVRTTRLSLLDCELAASNLSKVVRVMSRTTAQGFGSNRYSMLRFFGTPILSMTLLSVGKAITLATLLSMRDS